MTMTNIEDDIKLAWFLPIKSAFYATSENVGDDNVILQGNAAVSFLKNTLQNESGLLTSFSNA
jgi:hypothetical protein